MDSNELTEALLRLEGTVRANQTAMQAGFTQLRQMVQAQGEALEKHLDHCSECKAGLQGEILANERAARKREQDVAKDLHARIQGDIEPRLRKVEHWMGKVMGVGAAVALVAAFVQWLLGKVLLSS